MDFLSLKALHIIFVVCWFAGLFYIVRLFVYAAEAQGRPEGERSMLLPQFLLMQRRLWFGITWPAMVGTWVFGLLMVVQVPGYLEQGWFQVKLVLVLLLTFYHFACGRIHKRQQAALPVMGAQALRVWNEVATLFLVAVVFLVVCKTTLSAVNATLGLVVFAALLMSAILLYKRFRKK
jgi:putative membrane protein